MDDENKYFEIKVLTLIDLINLIHHAKTETTPTHESDTTPQGAASNNNLFAIENKELFKTD